MRFFKPKKYAYPEYKAVAFIDLDNTLIYSKRRLRNHLYMKKLIDFGDNKNIIVTDEELNSYIEENCKTIFDNGDYQIYMTNTSERLLKELMNKVPVIPVTARSLDNFKKLSLPMFDNSHLIIDNGANLYLNSGTEEQNKLIKSDWNTEITLKHTVPNFKRHIDNIVALINNYYDSGELDVKHNILAGKYDISFFLESSKNVQLMINLIYGYISGNNIQDEFTFFTCTDTFFGDNKTEVGVHLSNINKGKAISMFKERFKTDFTVAAGDNITDLPMLNTVNKHFLNPSMYYMDIYLDEPKEYSELYKSIKVSDTNGVLFSEYFLEKMIMYIDVDKTATKMVADFFNMDLDWNKSNRGKLSKEGAV